MTLFEVEELTCYWIEHPPPHLLIAAYLGAGRQQNRAGTASRSQAAPAPGPTGNVEELLAELGPAFLNTDVQDGLGPVVLDFGELRRKSGAKD